MNIFGLLKEKLVPRMNLKVALFDVFALAAVGSFVPNATSKGRSESCPVLSTTAALNIYPVTFSDPAELCHDFPALSARKLTDPDYPTTAASHAAGITAHEGETVRVRVFIHNGAIQ